MSIALIFIALALVLVGLAGTILPALPGVPLIFAGLLLIAYHDGFHKVGAITIVILGALTAIAFAADYLAGMLGAKRAGASRLAIIGAIVGALGGLFFGVAGIVLGPFVGAAVGELIARKNALQAGKVGLATWFGMIIGIAAKLGIALVMIGLFCFNYFMAK